MRTCQYCHTDNRDDAMYCNYCGAALIPGGAPVPPGYASSAGAPPSRATNNTGRLPPQSQLRGRYLILRLVGQGGMAAVYQATNLRTNTAVALKEMSQEGLTPTELKESLESFRFEAVTLQRLRHPNLPRVYESFSENTRHYLVMDYIDGKTLEQYQQAGGGGPLPEVEVLRWAEQLTSVLGYLHSQQPPIIFRDLKPSNIMLSTDGKIKLIDFGIARVFAPGRSRDTQVLGTPGFAPPEQYGKAQTDARADVYALGCTLYQLLTGYDPGTTPFNLPPISSRNPSVSAHIQRAIERATKLDREDRHPSMEAFARDLAVSPAASQTRAQTSARSASTASTASKATNTRGGGRSGVGAAAHMAPPTTASIVVVQPHTIDFGSLVAGQRGTQSFTISGQGYGPVQGQIKVLSPWLSLDRDRFSGPSTLVRLVAETSKLSRTGKQVSTLQIDCDRQHLYVPVTLNVLPAPAPVTKVVPAVGASTGRGGSSRGRKRKPQKISAKYMSPLVSSSRRGRLVRLATSVILAVGAVWSLLDFIQRLVQLRQFPFPLTLPVDIPLVALSILLGSAAALIGSGGPGWGRRLETTVFGSTAGAIVLLVLVLANGPYPWTVMWQGPIPLSISSALLRLAPLAIGLGAALGADTTISRWMSGTASFVGRFPRAFIGLAAAVACGIACHNLAWAGAGHSLVACVTVVGALIGGIVAYRLAGALQSAGSTRP